MEQSSQLGSPILTAYNAYVHPYGMRQLAPGFQPGQYDVLCARGKQAYDWIGNIRFRALVKQHQRSYSACTCKYQKSKIVSHIVNTVRNASPNGGFVKKVDGLWVEVGDRHSKEKVGQTFRDLLHTKYSSSTKAKARARAQRRMKKQLDFVTAGPTGKKSTSTMSDASVDSTSTNLSAPTFGAENDLKKTVSPMKDVVVAEGDFKAFFLPHQLGFAALPSLSQEHIFRLTPYQQANSLALLPSSIQTLDATEPAGQANEYNCSLLASPSNIPSLSSLEGGARHSGVNIDPSLEPLPIGESMDSKLSNSLKSKSGGNSKFAKKEETFVDAIDELHEKMNDSCVAV